MLWKLCRQRYESNLLIVYSRKLNINFQRAHRITVITRTECDHLGASWPFSHLVKEPIAKTKKTHYNFPHFVRKPNSLSRCLEQNFPENPFRCCPIKFPLGKLPVVVDPRAYQVNHSLTSRRRRLLLLLGDRRRWSPQCLGPPHPLVMRWLAGRNDKTFSHSRCFLPALLCWSGPKPAQQTNINNTKRPPPRADGRRPADDQQTTGRNTIRTYLRNSSKHLNYFFSGPSG